MNIQPVIPDSLRALLAQNVGPRVVGPPSLADQMQQANQQQAQNAPPPPPVPVNMMPPQAMPRLPISAPPNVVQPDPAVAATQARTLTDQNEQQRMLANGPGYRQITHPLDANGNATNQKPSLLRRFGGGLARIGDIAESIVAPGVAALTPGTTLHHDYLLNQQAGRVTGDLGDQREQAQTALLNAEPEIKQLGAENAFMRNQAYMQHVTDQGAHYTNQDVRQAADHGYKPDGKGGLVPMTYAEMSPTQQAMQDYNAARTGYENALADLTKAKNDPSSPAYRLAKQRVDAALQSSNIALSKLSLRRQEDDANFLGTYNGQPIGTFDDNGNPQGLRVTAANNPTTMRLRQSDLAHNVIQNAGSINQLIDQNPNLFGPMQGRFTTVQQMIGSDNPAIAQLGVEFHNIALASNGAHGLRSQEAVNATENELLNHYRNGPQATKAAVAAMTQSVQTFIDAANRGKRTLPNTDSGGQKPPAAPAGADVKVKGKDGKMYWANSKTKQVYRAVQ